MEVIYLPRVKRTLERLDDVLVERVARSVDFLEKYGNLIEMPISKPLDKGLFELRITGNNHIRIFYCFHKNAIYLVHSITKKQKAISQRDMLLARKVMKQIKLL